MEYQTVTFSATSCPCHVLRDANENLTGSCLIVIEGVSCLARIATLSYQGLAVRTTNRTYHIRLFSRDKSLYWSRSALYTTHTSGCIEAEAETGKGIWFETGVIELSLNLRAFASTSRLPSTSFDHVWCVLYVCTSNAAVNYENYPFPTRNLLPSKWYSYSSNSSDKKLLQAFQNSRSLALALFIYLIK